MSDAVGRADDAADRWFEFHLRGRPGIDRAFYTASAAGEFGAIWLIYGALQARRGPLARRRFRRLVVAMGLESAMVNGVVKSLFDRRRPVPDFERPLPLRIPITSSFPSGHASSALTAATLLSDGEESRALRALYWGTAALVAASRVHVKIHHASDVVGGLAVGRAYALAVRKVAPLDPH
ncbi:MAG TPA: phosphatase PAP2 family protein [Acidimicrobiales bacterium]